jgi:hypothetical protein
VTMDDASRDNRGAMLSAEEKLIAADKGKRWLSSTSEAATLVAELAIPEVCRRDLVVRAHAEELA